jgi:hypothetical protein
LYRQGDYAKARLLLARALADTPTGTAGRDELAATAKESGRLAELSLARELPAEVRTTHLLTASKIAQTRLADCAAHADKAGAELELAMTELQGRWKAVNTAAKLRAMAVDAAGQDTLTQLIFATERTTETVCGQPSGDDALLLKLAGGREGQE